MTDTTAAGHTPGLEWTPVADHDGSEESVIAICMTAYTPTPFEAWNTSEGWKLYSRGGEKQSSGVTKWFPTHFVTKADLFAAIRLATVAGDDRATQQGGES